MNRTSLNYSSAKVRLILTSHQPYTRFRCTSNLSILLYLLHPDSKLIQNFPTRNNQPTLSPSFLISFSSISYTTHSTSKMAVYPASMPWKLRLTFKFLGRVTDLTRRADGTLNRRFLNAVDFPASASLTPLAGVRTCDIALNPSLKIRVFAPVDETDHGSSSKRPVVVFFHGGGFAYLSAMTKSYDAVCRRFARKIGAVVVSVNYRLSPEHKCPAQYDDGIEVLRYLDSGKIRSEAVVQGIELDFRSCFLIGDSAGANISHHVARRYAMDKSSWKNVNVAGLITIQPFFGGEELTESEIRLEGAPLVSIERTNWMWKAFLPEGADRNHEAANVCLSVKSESYELGESFPPAMVVVGGYDPLQDWQKQYYEMLKKKGKEVRLVEYPDAVHAFYVLPFPESKLLLGEIVKFVHEKKVTSSCGNA